MILSDNMIRQSLVYGQLQVDPKPEDSAFQPASLELCIAETVTLHPGEFLLSHTLETVTMPDHLAGRLSGKSSLGRIGLLIHVTAGFIDPGFSGQIVLELKNLREPGGLSWPDENSIRLVKGQRVCQLEFHQVAGPVLRPYGHPELGSHYQHQIGTKKSYLEES